MPQPLPGNGSDKAEYPLGLPFIELQAVDSTNNYARGLVQDGTAQHGMAIFAHEQTRGKGQRGRIWISEKDSNIILSLLIKTDAFGIGEQFRLSACTAVALHEFFHSYCGDETKIKWPNDLYWQERKAGGILMENIVGPVPEKPGKSAWKWAIIGIGVNIKQSRFPSSLPNPVSMKQITGKEYDPVMLAKELCKRLNDYYIKLLAGDYKNILALYNTHLYKKDQKVQLKKNNRLFEAEIKCVTGDGKLVAKHHLEETFDFGEIQWLI